MTPRLIAKASARVGAFPFGTLGTKLSVCMLLTRCMSDLTDSPASVSACMIVT